MEELPYVFLKPLIKQRFLKDFSRFRYPKYSISLEPLQDFQMGHNSLIYLFKISANIYYEDQEIIHEINLNRTKETGNPSLENGQDNGNGASVRERVAVQMEQQAETSTGL